jgi:putative transposase
MGIELSTMDLLVPEGSLPAELCNYLQNVVAITYIFTLQLSTFLFCNKQKLDSVTKAWSDRYPAAMNRWHENWDAITPIFKFSKDVCTAFYTTNAIESLNSCYRRLNKQRSVFPSTQALLKALYLATFEISKKWTMPIRNWGKVRGELAIMYPDRMHD